MADTYTVINGHQIKLIDNGDSTFSIGAELTPSTSIIGKVGIDQTTDGTTNKVQAHVNVAAAAVSNTNPVPVRPVISATQVDSDAEDTWAASALVNTLKSTTWTKPTTVKKAYAVTISNPSLITDLTVKLYNLETSFNKETETGTETRKSLVGTLTVEKSTSVVVEDCEDVWNELAPANVTIATEGTIKKVGTNSNKFTYAAAAAAGAIVSEVISATNLTQYTHAQFYFYSDTALAAGDFQFLLDNTAQCASPLETLSLPAMSATTWYRVLLPFTDPSALGAIVSVGLKYTVDIGACNVYIDDVRAVNVTTKQTVIEGLFGAGNVYETKSNDTVLGADDAFTSVTRIREWE